MLRTALQLAPTPRYRPGLVRALKMAWILLKISAKVGFNRRTGLLYWKTLFAVLAANPKAAQAAIGMAALYDHFDKQSEFVMDMVERKIAEIESCGEEDYNARMIAGIAPVPLSTEHPLPHSQPA